MKRTFFLTLLLAFLSVFVANGQPNYEVLMTTVNEQPDDLEVPSRGNRTMPIKTKCIINENGIELINFSADILTYEINDVNGNFVAVFGDEETFVDFLFTLNGEYQLKFTTTFYELVGQLNM